MNLYLFLGCVLKLVHAITLKHNRTNCVREKLARKDFKRLLVLELPQSLATPAIVGFTPQAHTKTLEQDAGEDD